MIGVLALAVVVVCVLPASLITRFLPPSVQAEDFSGSVWHGSAGRITLYGRPAGAVEWDVHPAALLRLHLNADFHWVKGGFVLDGSTDLSRTRLSASDISGGGPIGDLKDLGIGAGWRGTAALRVSELTADLSSAATGAGAGAGPGAGAVAGPGVALTSAVGDITVADVSSPQVASGANLGGYDLHFNDPAAAAGGGDMSAALTDTGGPLSVDATIQLSMTTRSGVFSGTLKERADASAALRSQLDTLAQLHARDSSGRLPVEFEFTF